MAIYRPPKARWPVGVAAAVAGIICGLLIGLAVGSKDPDPIEAARDIQSALVTAAGSLEVAAIEYEEAVPSEGEVERFTEYKGARDALASSRAGYEEIRPALELLAPATTDRAGALYERCDELMDLAAEPAEVGACLGDLEALLKGEG